MPNQFRKDYFSFTRKERNAVVVLLILVALFFIVPSILPSGQPDMPVRADSALLKSVTRVKEFRDTVYYKKDYDNRQYKSKYPPRRYYPKTFTRPFTNDKGYPERDYKKDYSYPKPPAIVYINDADSAALLPLPGIGPRLAARIITFRDKLGGFYNIEQIAETYGLPDSTFQLIKGKLALGNTPPARININTADQDELKKHPYIRWNLANAIVQYRNQHGDFKDLDDLLKIGVVTIEIFEKMKPYLTVELTEK